MEIPPEGTEVILVTGTQVREITSEFFLALSHRTHLKEIYFENNMITKISKEIQNLQVEEIWLSGNPFHCDCDMIWMRDWLSSFNNATGKITVRDYRDLKCNNTKDKQVPIYQMSEVQLGCYPLWSTGQKVGAAVAALLFCLIFGLTIIVFQNLREVKFLLYYYLRLDTKPRDDPSENLTNKEYDAFLCFW